MMHSDSKCQMAKGCPEPARFGAENSIQVCHFHRKTTNIPYLQYLPKPVKAISQSIRSEVHSFLQALNSAVQDHVASKTQYITELTTRIQSPEMLQFLITYVENIYQEQIGLLISKSSPILQMLMMSLKISCGSGPKSIDVLISIILEALETVEDLDITRTNYMEIAEMASSLQKGDFRSKYKEAVYELLHGKIQELLSNESIEEAIQFFYIVNSICRSVLSESLPNAFSEIAESFIATHQFKEALEALGPVSMFYQNTKSLAEASVMNLMGMVYFKKGNLATALEYYSASLTIKQQLIGNDSYEAAESYFNIGLAYSELGKYQKALQFLEASLSIMKTTGDDLKVADLLNSIGSVYFSCYSFHESSDYFQKSKEIYEELEDANICSVYNNIAALYMQTDRKEEAMKLYQKSLLITKEKYGDLHANVAVCLSNIAEGYQLLGMPEDSYRAYELSFTILIKLYGEDHPQSVQVLLNMAHSFQSFKDFEEAFKHYNRALEICIQNQTLHSSRIAEIYSLIGSAHKDQGSLNEALDYFQKSLEVRRKYFGDTSVGVGKTLNNLGVLYMELEQPADARWYFNRSLEILKGNFDEMNPMIQLITDNLKAIGA